jgi:hypothetical protein
MTRGSEQQTDRAAFSPLSLSPLSQPLSTGSSGSAQALSVSPSRRFAVSFKSFASFLLYVTPLYYLLCIPHYNSANALEVALAFALVSLSFRSY